MKKTHKGTRVGASFRRQKRWREDREYKEKITKYMKEYEKKHRLYYAQRRREWVKELSEFKNMHCKLCGKLLNWRTKGKYCNECLFSNPFLRVN